MAKAKREMYSLAFLQAETVKMFCMQLLRHMQKE